MIIRDMREDELPTIGHFPPEDWNLDIVAKFKALYGKCEFYPFVAEKNGESVGICSALINGNSGWLGHILVLPEFRNQGIGRAMTEFLISFLKERGCESMVLTATEMGEPIYRKCGFESVGTYRVYIGESLNELPKENYPERGNESVLDEVLQLDLDVTGEDRSHLLKPFCDEIWIRRDTAGTLQGFFIPGYGEGFVVARDEQVGLELLHYKLTVGRPAVMVPVDNSAAVQFLENAGFEQGYECPRMELGANVNWNPGGIFCRTGGDCG